MIGVTSLVLGRSRRFYLLLVVLVALLIGLLVEGIAWHDRAAADAVRVARCERFTHQQEARAAAVSGSGPRVVVIGDSWSSGFGLASPQHSWPVRLPGRVYVDGFPGSGFGAHTSGCHQVAYAQRAAHDVRRHPSLVVIEGGLNDFDQPSAAIADGFSRLMRQLRGQHVVVVGPASAPSRAAAVPRVDRLLAALSAKAHVPYFSTVDLKLTYQPDRLHPDQQGADAYGDAVAGFIADRSA